MSAKDFGIYQEITNEAAAVFENIKCAPGKYAPADIAKYIKVDEDKEYKNGVYVITGVKYSWIKDAPFCWADNYDPLQLHTVSVDTFSCRFNSWGVFSILKKCAAAWGIPAAHKCTLIREKETAAAVVSFNVPAVAKDIIKVPAANVKDQPEKIVYHFVAVDTRRRCLVVTNGNILTAVAVDEMNVAKDAAAVYLINPKLLKTGKGTVEIDANGNAANGGVCFPVAADLQFPRWEKVLPAVQDARAVEIGNKQFKQLKKEITAAAKSANKYCPVVTISGKTGNDYLTISAADIEFCTENSRRVSLPQPCAFDFVFPVAAKLFASVPAAEKIYLAAEYLPYFKSYSGVLIFAAAKMFSLYLPTISENKEIPAPAAEDAPAVPVLKVCRFPDVQETAAAVDEETPAAYAVPADRMPQETPAAVQDEETAAPAAEDTPAVQDEETAAPAAEDAPAVQDEETAPAAPVAEDAPETAANVQDEETPAVADSVPAADIETLINNKFAAYLNAAPVAAEDAPAVQDEETAPAVAVSLPVPCFEETKHAVYIDGVLHGVYFSKLLADAVLFDAFLAGRSVYPLQLSANETAPETERAAVAVSVAADSETPAADSVPAEDAQETAPAVQNEETPAADSVPAEDAQETAPAVQNEETPAVLIGCPSRSGNARRFAPWLIRVAAVVAVLLLSVFASWERETPAVAVDIVSAVPVAAEDAPAVQDAQETAPAAPADSVKQFAAVAAEDAPETPAVAAAVPVADKQPQRMKKHPQTAKETAAAAFEDAQPVPADSVPAVDEETPQTAKDTAPAVAAEDAQETAPAVQDEETPAADSETPAVADSTPQDEETPAADSVPADSVPAANSPAPAVPAVSGCPAPAVPAAVTPYVIGCVFIH